jgi:hypothetical protein
MVTFKILALLFKTATNRGHDNVNLYKLPSKYLLDTATYVLLNKTNDRKMASLHIQMAGIKGVR